MRFDDRARGWTSYTGDLPTRGGCSCTWMIPEFRARALADSEALERSLVKLTKAQLRDFLARGGRDNFCGLVTKRDLVDAAHRDQMQAWYPYMEEC